MIVVYIINNNHTIVNKKLYFERRTYENQTGHKKIYMAMAEKGVTATDIAKSAQPRDGQAVISATILGREGGRCQYQKTQLC